MFERVPASVLDLFVAPCLLDVDVARALCASRGTCSRSTPTAVGSWIRPPGGGSAAARAAAISSGTSVACASTCGFRKSSTRAHSENHGRRESTHRQTGGLAGWASRRQKPKQRTPSSCVSVNVNASAADERIESSSASAHVNSSTAAVCCEEDAVVPLAAKTSVGRRPPDGERSSDVRTMSSKSGVSAAILRSASAPQAQRRSTGGRRRSSAQLLCLTRAR